MKTIRTSEKKGLFLRALAQGLSVGAGLKASGMSRTAAYAWRNDDEDFKVAWDAAIEEGTDELEDMAVLRAATSDTLLIFMLKARRPNKYRERMSLEHTGKDGGPVEIKELDPMERLRRIAFLMTQATTET